MLINRSGQLTGLPGSSGNGNAPPRLLADRSQAVEHRELSGDTYEICATSLAHYTDESSELELQLGSFVRRINPRGRDEIMHPAWLPRTDTIRHSMSLDDAIEEAKQKQAD